jgi:hypothetical protein
MGNLCQGVKSKNTQALDKNDENKDKFIGEGKKLVNYQKF